MSVSDGAPEPQSKGQLEREAANWCVKMHGPDAELHRPAFEAWLRLGALHRYTYNRIDEVYVMSGRLGARRAAALSEGPLPLEDGVARSRVGSAWLPVAAGLTLGVALVLFFLAPATAPLMPGNEANRAAVRLTATSSMQEFDLSDGSRVQLAAGSTLLVSLDASRRSLTLVAGRGRFDVAHERRPFVVSAAGGRITARGTRFDVALSRAAVVVRLFEGQCDIAYPAGGVQGSEIVEHLVAGEETRFPVSRPAPAPGRGSSRQSARQPATVGELADRANASGNGSYRIEIADPALRAVEISGVFEVHDPVTTADRLAAMLDLVIDRTQAGVLRLARHSP